MYRTNGYSTRHGVPWKIQLWSAKSVGNVSNVGSKYRIPSISQIPFCDYDQFFHRTPNAHRCEIILTNFFRFL